jgi:hypothetical protein
MRQRHGFDSVAALVHQSAGVQRQALAAGELEFCDEGVGVQRL